MTPIILAIAITLVAGAFFWWLVRTMLEKRCPNCTAKGQDSLLVPVIPGFRFWCLACGDVFTGEQVAAGDLEAGAAAGQAPAAEEPAAPQRAPERPRPEPQAPPPAPAPSAGQGQPAPPAGDEEPERPRLDFS